MGTTSLPVFRKMYDLNKYILQFVDKFPKAYKYNLGDKLVNTSLNLFKYLFSANRDKNRRIEFLESFLDDFDLLKVLIRLSNELRLFSISDSAILAGLTENITKQVSGWRNKTEKSK